MTAGLAGFNLTGPASRGAERVLDTVGTLKKHALGTPLGHEGHAALHLLRLGTRPLRSGPFRRHQLRHKAGYWKSDADEFKNVAAGLLLHRHHRRLDPTIPTTRMAYNQVVTSSRQRPSVYESTAPHYGWRSLDASRTDRNYKGSSGSSGRQGEVLRVSSTRDADSGYPTYPENHLCRDRVGHRSLDAGSGHHDYPKDIEEVFAKRARPASA